MLKTDIQLELVVTIIDKGLASDVIDITKKAGAKGATIINGRGSGIHETAKLFGIPIEPEKEIILTLTDCNKTEKILELLSQGIGLNEPGKGIAFVLDVEKAVGICSFDEPLLGK
jgi:nitrogen regulatory protein PII